MLQALRSKGASIVVKLLFVLLIASFALWGIGDYAFLRRADPTVATIGNVKITAPQLAEEYRRELSLIRRSMGDFDNEQARQFGVPERVLDRLVATALVDEESARLGLTISDDTIRAHILADPNFRGPGGQFDRNVYQRVLYDNNLTEQRFIDLMRLELKRGMLTRSLETGAVVGAPVFDALYAYRNERRVGEIVTVNAADFPEAGEPDAAAVEAYYQEQGDQFMAPEMRTITFVRLTPAELAAKAPVTDAEIEEEYRARLAEFRVAERRELEQILAPDEAAAKAARAKIEGGAALADVAAEAGQSAEQVKLGALTQADLVPELSTPVFALPQGGLSEAIQSPFGWHVIKVVAIQPGTTPSIDDLKERLRADIARRHAEELVVQTGNRLEDEIIAGVHLAEAAKKLELTAVTAGPIDARGFGPDGAPNPQIATDRDLLRAAFSARQGEETPLAEGQGGSVYVLRVDSISPAAKKPLDQVRPEIVEAWKNEKRMEMAKARAEEIRTAAAASTLADAAAAHQIPIGETPAVTRVSAYTDQPNAAPEVVAQLFQMKAPGDLAVVAGRSGYSVARLKEIRAPDRSQDPDTVAKLGEELRQAIATDVSASFGEALRRRYGVTISATALDSLL